MAGPYIKSVRLNMIKSNYSLFCSCLGRQLCRHARIIASGVQNRTEIILCPLGHASSRRCHCTVCEATIHTPRPANGLKPNPQQIISLFQPNPIHLSFFLPNPTHQLLSTQPNQPVTFYPTQPRKWAAPARWIHGGLLHGEARWRHSNPPNKEQGQGWIRKKKGPRPKQPCYSMLRGLSIIRKKKNTLILLLPRNDNQFSLLLFHGPLPKTDFAADAKRNPNATLMLLVSFFFHPINR